MRISPPGRTTSAGMEEKLTSAFFEALVAAVSARGSMLAVAERLGVAPATVYRWIAGFELPDVGEQGRLMTLLRGG